MTAKTRTVPVASEERDDRKTRVSQSDVPAYTLDEALRVARGIGENYAFQAAPPLDVAVALNLSPSSSLFRMICGASIAYGLTDGGYNASSITPTALARRILEPTEEGADTKARREAVLKPRVLREFLSKYDGYRVPAQDIARNVLVQLGVPRDSTERTLDLILSTARSVGFLTDIKGVAYVKLQGAVMPSPATDDQQADSEDDPSKKAAIEDRGTPPASPQKPQAATAIGGTSGSENRRVFITHGKNTAFLEPLKDLLGFGELEAVVSIERESVSQPVPDKVLEDMRRCGAAIIHVDAEQKLLDLDAKSHVVLNPNVLIEIGAAMALYNRRFILLVREGIELPSNLQGLYQVRYTGDRLDGDATIKLLKAIKDIKNHALPSLTAQMSKEALA